MKTTVFFVRLSSELPISGAAFGTAHQNTLRALTLQADDLHPKVKGMDC